jgi:hypothetical protein
VDPASPYDAAGRGEPDGHRARGLRACRVLRARPDAEADARLDDLVLADESLDAFIDDVCAKEGLSRESLLSTDDNLRLEYATPRNNVPAAASVVDVLRGLQRPDGVARLRGRQE